MGWRKKNVLKWGKGSPWSWSGDVNISTISPYIHNDVFSSSIPLTSLTDVPCSCSNYSRSSHFDRKVHWLNQPSILLLPLTSTTLACMIKEVMCSHTVSIGLLSFPLPLSSCSIKENRIVGYLKLTKKAWWIVTN